MTDVQQSTSQIVQPADVPFIVKVATLSAKQTQQVVETDMVEVSIEKGETGVEEKEVNFEGEGIKVGLCKVSSPIPTVSVALKRMMRGDGVGRVEVEDSDDQEVSGEVIREVNVEGSDDEEAIGEGGVGNKVVDEIYEDFGLVLKGRIADIANSSTAYKRFGSVFIFIGPTYADGIYMYHFKNKSIHLSVEEIQTIIFSASRVVTMYDEGFYHDYEGEVYNVILGRFKGVELYMGVDSVFINNIVSLEMRMGEFSRMYKYLLKHRSLFLNPITALPCAFSHSNKADYLGCNKCQKF